MLVVVSDCGGGSCGAVGCCFCVGCCLCLK